MIDIPIIDAHLHIYDIDHFNYPWLADEPAINRTHLVADYREATRGIDIEKMAVAGVIPVQNRPFDVIADDAEKYAFVSCHASDQVSVIDLDARSEVFRLETGPGPVDLNLSDGRLLIADSEGLGIFDLNSLPY